MVEPMKSHGHHGPQGQRNRFTQEQEIIESVAETLEECGEPVELPSQPANNKSFFATIMSFAPYVIMGMGAYMIWTRARAMFKPPHQDEGHG